MIRAVKHSVPANTVKQDQLVGLFKPWRAALVDLSTLTIRDLLQGCGLAKWRTKDQLVFETVLSARQVKSAQNQCFMAHSSWLALLQNRVRELITGSTLDSDLKTVLYRVNAQQGWWNKSIELAWKIDHDGCLIPCSTKSAGAVTLPVHHATLKICRRLVKQAQKQVGRPDLSRVKTITLDSIIAKPEHSSGRHGWMVKVATLTARKPIWVPLTRNPYFDRVLTTPGTRLCGAIQMHLRDTGSVAISLIAETPDQPARTEGHVLGVDWGMRHALLATSEGQLLGGRMLARLAELDQQLTATQARLQKSGKKPTSDPTYRALQARIKGYVTNEIGRILNQIAARNGNNTVREIVVEKLDFRGGGMSRTMNRLITRTGRTIFKQRLTRLTEAHGITITPVPAPYSSQQCSGCGYTHRLNRNRTGFHCRFCGLKLHADINAARTVRARRSDALPDHTGPKSRANTRHQLDINHRTRWNLPTAGAVPDATDAPGTPQHH